MFVLELCNIWDQISTSREENGGLVVYVIATPIRIFLS